MAESLLTRIFREKILIKEQRAQQYLKQNLVAAHVRYGAISKTRATGSILYFKKANSNQESLRRESSKHSLVLLASGNERLAHVKALIDENLDGNYKIASVALYHIDEETQKLSVDMIKTYENYQNKGIGSAVMDFIKDIAIASKCKTVELDSVRKAVGFYGKKGFRTAEAQVCSKDSLTTMVWDVDGNYTTNSFTVNELNLMMQRGRNMLK